MDVDAIALIAWTLVVFGGIVLVGLDLRTMLVVVGGGGGGEDVRNTIYYLY